MKKKQLKQVRKLAMLLSATLLLEQPAVVNSTLHVYAQGETVTTEASEVETSEATDESIETVATEESVEAATETSTEVSNETSEAVLADSSDEASNSEASDATDTSSESSETDATDASNASSETDTTDASNESSEADATDASNESSETDATDASNESSETDATDATDTAAETSNEESQPLKEKATEQFTDIPEGEWYVDAVQFVYSQKIMNGVDNTLFGPSGTLTREQFITVIYNMENKPETAFQKIYEDVADEALWYAKPVTWASVNGITSGIGTGLFGTGKEITREQLATLLYNYAKEVDQFKLTIDEKLVANFPDAGQISDWATTGMGWAITNKVMSGKAGQDGKNFLDPKGNATRAECAQMIKNLKENAIKGSDSEESSEEDNDPLVGTEKVIDDQTIVNIDTSSAPKPVGKIFFKELVFEDEIGRTPDGFDCFRDQILIYVNDGVNYDTVDAYVKEDNARIVGCIESIGWYQIEFNSYLSVNELGEKKNAYENKDLVDQVGYNLITEESLDFHSSDLYGKTSLSNIDDWESDSPAGKNWGIEEIDLAGALLHAKVINSLNDSPDDVKTDHLSFTKIGIIDDAFDWAHEDLSFEKVWADYSPRNSKGNLYNAYHGTAVAGIIGAEFNNATGITGVSIKSQLYGYSKEMNTDKYTELYDTLISKGDKKIVDSQSTFARDLIAVALLITVDNVKVINYSLGWGRLAFAMSFNGSLKEATERRDKAKEYLDEGSAAMAKALNHFIKNGYDFLIVTSAGNANNVSFYRCNIDKGICGYIPVSDYNDNKDNYSDYGVRTEKTFGGTNSGADVISGVPMQAKYNNIFTYIPYTEPCYDHIVVVGAMNGQNKKYDYCNFTNVGDRVDLFAPGTKIYTCTVANGIQDKYTPNFGGTSASAPFVTGSIGLAYSVEPNLKAVDLKKMLVETSKDRLPQYLINGVVDPTTTQHVLNVGKLIEYIETQKDTNRGMLHLTIVDPAGNPVPGAEVKICHMDTCYANAMGGLIWEAVEPNTFLINTQSDNNGEVTISLPAKSNTNNGCYVILADKNNSSGNVLSIGRMEWPRCLFYDGIEPVSYNERTITLVPYSQSSQTVNVGLQIVSEDQGILYSSKISFYEGWHLKNFNDPMYEFTSPAKGVFFGELTRENVPKGRYTVKVENPGYQTRYVEILVTDNVQTYSIYVNK